MTQPPSLRIANVFFAIATSGGTRTLEKRGATHAMADSYVDDQLALPTPAGANDFLFQWNASFNYDPEPMLAQIEAQVLAINAADDERNPSETGVMARGMRQVRDGRLYLIPASEDTHGHGTTGFAKFWAPQLQSLLQTVPRRPM